MIRSEIPRPFSYYQAAIVAFRQGREAEASHYLVTVMECLSEGFRNASSALSPRLVQCMRQLTAAKERNDQTAMADLLEFDLPAAGLFEALPLRRLQLKLTPASQQQRGLPVTVEIEAEAAPGVELEYRAEPYYLGPEPSPVEFSLFVPPHRRMEYAPDLLRRWETPAVPGRYFATVWARLRGSSGPHLMTDQLIYRIT